MPSFLIEHWLIWLEPVALLMLAAAVLAFRPTASNLPSHFAQNKWSLQHAIGLVLLSYILYFGSHLLYQSLSRPSYPALVLILVTPAVLVSLPILFVRYFCPSLSTIGISRSTLLSYSVTGLRYGLILVLVRYLLLYWMANDSISSHFEYQRIPSVAAWVERFGLLWGGVVSVLLPSFWNVSCLALYEELLYRGVFYGALRKHFNPLSAILICTVFFTWGHDSILIPALFGLLTAWLVEKTHSVIPGFVLHLTWNFSISMATFMASTAILEPVNYVRIVIIMSMVGLLAIFLIEVINAVRKGQGTQRAPSVT